MRAARLVRGLASSTPLAFAALATLAACGDNLGAAGDDAPPADTAGLHVYHFGPYTLASGEEHAAQCVSVTLHNELPMFANEITLTTGPGFHHSNWFWVPEDHYAGPDGTWPCSERGFDEPLAAAVGGVLFAQSTQATDESQAFPPGVAIPIPPHAKIVAGVHLLNASDEAVDTSLDLTVHTIPEDQLQVQLAGLSFTDQALDLPAGRRSSFTVDCDFDRIHQQQLGRPPDFHIYWVLPHYHTLGRGIDLVATGAGGDTTVVSTEGTIGEPLGQRLAPPFSMSGHTGLRFTCRFDNPRDQDVYWGNGDQEMCVMLAFTDSEMQWGGGALDDEAGEPQDLGDHVAFQHPCQLYGLTANRW
ncbi:MAG TPA: hypothetical protein VHE35_22550 [Kofleriaceae bacterium]|nr:hypothetical protein [Kofleriaceae bacterium]